MTSAVSKAVAPELVIDLDGGCPEDGTNRFEDGNSRTGCHLRHLCAIFEVFAKVACKRRCHLRDLSATFEARLPSSNGCLPFHLNTATRNADSSAVSRPWSDVTG
jgi:hypothetical protein